MSCFIGYVKWLLYCNNFYYGLQRGNKKITAAFFTG